MNAQALKHLVVGIARPLLRPLPDSFRRPLSSLARRWKLVGGHEVGEFADLYLRIYEQAQRAFEKGSYDDAIAAVSAHDHLRDATHLKSSVLFKARLVRVDAFMASGRAHDATSALSWLEGLYGASWEILIRRARLGPLTGDYQSAMAAIDRALICVPRTRNTNNNHALVEAALIKVDLLVRLGAHRRAREFLLRVFGPSVHGFTDRQLAGLRRTIVDSESLEELKELLLGSIASTSKRSLAALFNYSIAARDLDHYEEALWAIQQRFIIGVRTLQFGNKPRRAREDWSAAARQALLDLRSDLSRADVKFFLVSGTLLGCVREGNILGHDKDIDVGVMEDVDFEKVRSSLTGTGRFVPLPVITKRILRVRHANGVMIDIFFHWVENGRMYHEGQKTRWWNTPFELVERDFLGERFLVPNDADRYLTENYGDWRTPVADFETFCDTPNMEISDEQELIWYYYKALLDHYHAGNAKQFEKVWRRILAMSDPSVDVRRALEAAQQAMGERGAAKR